ncbi:GNAT family N-acetyltransferase [Bilophila wadsworthia]|jgi:ribosomal-protein-alanine N-acetyltransferase
MGFTNTPTLETERLLLRRFSENDLYALFKIHSDKDVNTYLPWFPLQSIEEASLFLRERYLDTYRQPYGYKYAICLKNDNIPIGYVNIGINEPHDLGYGLLKAFWRNGIVTEAANAVIHQVKKDGIPYITATHDIKNPRSGNVMKRLGMLYQYSYKEQWQPKNILTTFCMYQLNLDGQDKRVYKGYLDQSPNQAD